MRRAKVIVLALLLGCGGGGGSEERDAAEEMQDARARPGGRGGAGSPAGGAGGAAGGAGGGGSGPDAAADAPLDARAADAGGGGGGQPDVPTVNRPRVAFSEIMYHPVLENADVDEHEFIELHNPGTQSVMLGGWRLAGDVAFTFPAGTALGAGQFLVVAKNRQKLLAVTAYMLDAARVVGGYERSLDNGGGAVSLLDGAGAIIDAVRWDDAFPWPLGADALGAGDEWLKPTDLPLTAHQHRGRSLERVSYEQPANDVANWTPSPLDGATPGQKSSNSGVAHAIAAHFEVKPATGDDPLVRANQMALVSVQLAGGAVTDPAIEWFADAIDKTGEEVVTAPLTAAGGMHQATLPGHRANTVVRYRFVGKRAGVREVISPRPSDPKEWHAYFVSPVVAGTTRAYHLFVSPQDWGRMWTNVEKGKVLGCPLGVLAPMGCPGQCMKNPTWNTRVPAVFVHEGNVYDVRVRYQGSKVNRLNGRALKSWPHLRPTAGPAMPPVLSWHVKFPRYAPFEKKGTLLLNKMTQACPGFPNAVAGKLAEAIGIPASQVRFARMFVNEGYYNYAMEIEHVDDDLLGRFHGANATIGDLFKADGQRWDEGPTGWGDGRLLQAYCGYTARERYEHTYTRENHDWRTSDEMVKLIEDLHVARAGGVPAIKAFLEKTYDVPLLLSYIALVNWTSTWDDSFHNHFFYKRPADGKWMVLPWDFDQTMACRGMTDCAPIRFSPYIGRQGDPDNRFMIFNYLKDAALQAFLPEYNARLKQLLAKELAPANVTKLIDEAAASLVTAEANQALSGMSCNPETYANEMRRFARERHAFLVMKLGM